MEALYGSALYHELLAFRYEHLRRPLGLEWSAEDLQGEDAQFHYGIWSVRAPIGCVVFKPLDEDRVLLRQMAVAPLSRGGGIGAALVRDGVDRMREKGYRLAVSHVRETARGFYEKLGFAAQGETFIQATLPTVKMLRTL